MLRFTLQIKNADQVDFALAGLRGDLDNYSQVWPAVTEEIEKEEAALFVTRGAVGAHGPWAPLTEKYLERKYKKYGEQQIEVATGRLRRALTDSTSGDAIRQYLPRSMRFGTTLPYAVYQQTGWRPSHLGCFGLLGTIVDRMVGKKKPRERFAEGFVPPRRVIDPTPDLGTAIQRAMMKAIDTMARRRGFAAASALGITNMGPGQARTTGYGILTGQLLGEGIS
ncbi:MAG TPA: hypothetical protein VFC10_07445 [Terriglobia bacterium]|jgi:hypothetical protein|nr:hypothetical protein [Terracidiphilus sp.]HZT69568.1 hypothetical protein [Terriglobia bacterium]